MTRTAPNSRLARLVRAISGEGGEAWLLPRAARRYVMDHDPAKTRAAVLRVSALALAALALLTALVWLGASAASALLARL